MRPAFGARQPDDGLGFRLRAQEPSRLEGFSDAVFGFAITLLVVSLEVPKTYADLLTTLRGFPAFAASFAILFLLWHAQYKWFRRYALHDGVSMLLHATLLFLVLLFVYPLKFVFSLVVSSWMGLDLTVHLPDGRAVSPVTPAEIGPMMTIYGLGYAAIFAVFALLHLHALRRAAALGLDALERADTRTSLRESALNVGVGLGSIALAHGAGASLAGLAYLSLGPILTLHGMWSGARRKRLEKGVLEHK